MNSHASRAKRSNEGSRGAKRGCNMHIERSPKAKNDLVGHSINDEHDGESPRVQTVRIIIASAAYLSDRAPHTME